MVELLNFPSVRLMASQAVDFPLNFKLPVMNIGMTGSAMRRQLRENLIFLSLLILLEVTCTTSLLGMCAS
jgi:hypothetical protein